MAKESSFIKAYILNGQPVCEIYGLSSIQATSLLRAVINRIEADVLKGITDGAVSDTMPPVSPTGYRAASVKELLQHSQRRAIESLCRYIGVDPDKECRENMDCTVEELSYPGAIVFIRILEDRRKL